MDQPKRPSPNVFTNHRWTKQSFILLLLSCMFLPGLYRARKRWASRMRMRSTPPTQLPSRIGRKLENPNTNTMCCEQTFAWLSRYKRILNSMPKTHHHFYLHRMVKRRNAYIEQCYAHRRRPVMPNVKTD